MSVKTHGETVIREYEADGVTYRVIKINQTKYPSMRHESADLDGKPTNQYATTVVNSDTGYEYSYTPRPYREALSWFEDKEG